jgi:hypothetical protein
MVFRVVKCLIADSTTEPEKTGIDNITSFLALDYSSFVGVITSIQQSKISDL